ncbi:hypothetical protein ACWEQL_34065 [Kitasatospora sp. NPDC004240]
MNRWVWRAAAIGSGAGAAALGATVVLVDLDTADRAASVVGAVVALAGLVLALRPLLRSGSGAGPGGPAGQGGPAGEAWVEVTGGGVGARRDIIGAHAFATGQPVPDPGVDPQTLVVRVDGDGSVGAGGSIVGIDLGNRR